MPIPQAPAPVYELKITLPGIDPPIWRRIQVPSAMLLCCLHDAIQVVMGWTDSHLHQFEKDGKNWGVTETVEFGELDLIDESRVPVAEVLQAEGDSMLYVYDFGDNWRHEIVLENILPPETRTKPVCLAGQRRCPPEDVGGTSGYEEFLEVIFQPGHEEFEHYRAWAENPVHAEEFDLEAVNAKLSKMRWPVKHRRE
jgi:Plasmid pRiA4b ORF-3-like protein